MQAWTPKSLKCFQISCYWNWILCTMYLCTFSRQYFWFFVIFSNGIVTE